MQLNTGWYCITTQQRTCMICLIQLELEVRQGCFDKLAQRLPSQKILVNMKMK